jgi:hypothetical protein
VWPLFSQLLTELPMIFHSHSFVTTKKIKMKICKVILTNIFILLAACWNLSYSQELTKFCNLTAGELKIKFDGLAMKPLRNELQSKGFVRLITPGSSYGFTGNHKDADGKMAEVEFYAYDYYNKATNQMGSLIWRNNGKSVYKAYLIFPAGEKDFEKALESSVEMYLDATGKIQKASSFGRCWRRCVFKNCVTWCVGSISLCAAATATLAIASAGPTAGIGVGAAVAIFAGCAGITCGTCFAVCAVGCF